MKYRKISISIILILVINLFTGCWDKVEVEEQGYVAAIGVDKGEGKMLKVTFQIINPRGMGRNKVQSGGGNSNTSDIITIESGGIVTARDLVAVSITRRLDLSHAKVIIVGEEFAKTDKFFFSLEAAMRDKQLRRSMIMMVSREKAEEFIRRNKPSMETGAMRFFQFMATRWKEVGYVPSKSTLNRFMQRTEQGESIFLATYGTTKVFSKGEGKNAIDYLPGQLNITEDNPTEIIGASVFKNGKMIGNLTGDETRLISFLRPVPEVRTLVYMLDDPLDNNYKIGTRIRKESKTKVKINISEGPPIIDVTVPLSMELVDIPSFQSYPEDINKQKLLKDSIEVHLENESKKLVKKFQSKFKGDPFLWENIARKSFLTYDDYKNYSWMKTFPKADVNIKYEITLIGFGKQLNPPNKNDVEQSLK